MILPNATRWNSYYYANATDKIRVVIDQCAKYNDCEVFSILEVPLLKSEELVFLNEVCKVMQPLACSLDILQGESKCYMGVLHPTLASLNSKLGATQRSLKYCEPLVEALLKGVHDRFNSYSEKHDLIV